MEMELMLPTPTEFLEGLESLDRNPWRYSFLYCGGSAFTRLSYALEIVAMDDASHLRFAFDLDMRSSNMILAGLHQIWGKVGFQVAIILPDLYVRVYFASLFKGIWPSGSPAECDRFVERMCQCRDKWIPKLDLDGDLDRLHRWFDNVTGCSQVEIDESECVNKESQPNS